MVALHYAQSRAANEPVIAPTATATTHSPSPAFPACDTPSNYAVNLDLTRALPPRPEHLAVRGLVVVTRHGSRTPMALLPGGGGVEARKAQFLDTWGYCPLANHTLVTCQRGLLTTFGELQLHTAGWWMRQQFGYRDAFLPREFDPAFFALRSTDLPRTKLSLLRMMQGVYPGLGADDLAKHVEVRKQAEETLYPNHYFCPRLKELYIDAAHTCRQNQTGSPAAIYKSIADSPEATALRSKFAKALGTNESALGTWVVIGDELKCRQGVGLPQEPGVTQAMADRANELAEETFWHIMRGGAPVDHCALRPRSSTSSDLFDVAKTPLEAEVVRLGVGKLMGEMFDGMDRIKKAHAAGPAAADKSVPRCLIYSGHDTTIAPLLAGLHSTHALMGPQQSAPGWPTFASNMMLELLERVEGPTYADEDVKASSRPERIPAHTGLKDSLAPLPPSATEDDEHTLPPQGNGVNGKTTASSATVSAPPAAVAAAATPSSSTSRWFVRLLVDHKEVSLLPYDEYNKLRRAYAVQDWVAECKQRSAEDLPAHHW